MARHREMYVEAMAFSPSAGATLLAGTPNYLFRTGAAPAELIARDSVFGVIVSAGGKGVVVPAPIPASRIGSVRAVPIGRERWAVVFAEMTDDYDPARSSTVAHLWFATLDRTGWRDRTELPAGVNAKINLAGASRLAYRNGDLVWAVRYGALDTSGIALFERTDGRWSLGRAPGDAGAYVEIASWTETALELAVVKAGHEVGHDSNSLFLYRRGTRWDEGQRAVRGGDEPIHRPAVAEVAGERVMTWVVRTASAQGWQGRTSVGADTGKVMTVDSSADQVLATGAPAGPVLWLSHHLGGGGADGELRIFQHSRAGAALLAAIPYPFQGRFSAAVVNGSTLLIEGPLLERDRASLTTLLLSFRLRCNRNASGASRRVGRT